MSLPIADGLSVLYVLLHEWLAGRDLRAAMGVKPEELDRLDDALGLNGRVGSNRGAQVAAMGGEIG